MAYACHLQLLDLNPHLICSLCAGYLIDATTIIECLHSFCRTCIVKHLSKSKYCPTCEVQVHKTKPLENVRADKTLQTLVYKLVPGLLDDERKRRKTFCAENPAAKESSSEARLCDFAGISDCDVAQLVTGSNKGQLPWLSDVFHTPDPTPEENISLCLQHYDKPPPFRFDEVSEEKYDRRYLLCPSAITIGHLKKFLQMKFELPENYQISIYHSDESLANVYTLMDIASIYTWRKVEPLRLYYTVWDGRVHSEKMVPPSPFKVVNTEEMDEEADSKEVDVVRPQTPKMACKRKIGELTPEEKHEMKKCKLEKLRKRTKKLKQKFKKTKDEKLKEKLKRKLKLKRKIEGQLQSESERLNVAPWVKSDGKKHKKKKEKKKGGEKKAEKEGEEKTECDSKVMEEVSEVKASEETKMEEAPCKEAETNEKNKEPCTEVELEDKKEEEKGKGGSEDEKEDTVCAQTDDKCEEALDSDSCKTEDIPPPVLIVSSLNAQLEDSAKDAVSVAENDKNHHSECVRMCSQPQKDTENVKPSPAKKRVAGKENVTRIKLRHSKRKAARDTNKKLLTRKIRRRRVSHVSEISSGGGTDRPNRIAQLKARLKRLKRNLSYDYVSRSGLSIRGRAYQKRK